MRDDYVESEKEEILLQTPRPTAEIWIKLNKSASVSVSFAYKVSQLYIN